MPRYYFHTADGREHRDEHGAELPDLSSVRDVALATMTEMAHACRDDFWKDQSLRITVTDDSGLTLMSLDLTATMSPALPDRERTLRPG